MKSIVLTLFAGCLLASMVYGQTTLTIGPAQITLVGIDGTPYCDAPIIGGQGVLVYGTVNMTTNCGFAFDGLAIGTYGVAFDIAPIPAGTYGNTANVASTGYAANGLGINVIYVLDFKNKLWSIVVGDGISASVVNRGSFYFGAPLKASRISSLAGAKPAGK
ncbi:MAG: hypothetical protein ABI693_14045 [Bryobacteraceae bacterium]